MVDDGAEPWIENCIITDNWTRYFASGIEFLDAEGGYVINCLISSNVARQGSGIWIAGMGPVIQNCTIVNNRDLLGTGGGISGGNSNAIISNCVVWGNWPSQIIGNTQVSYCDVQNGEPGIGNIDADPLFVAGPEGNYYLSQLAAGQTQQSPCVDAGDPLSAMILGTTRTDGVPDSGIVDMGYHYPLPASVSMIASHSGKEPFGTYNLELRTSSFPNPFNATTAISFELRAASFVTLGVYGVSGRMVAQLVNAWREAGTYDLAFDGSLLPSGVYLARLEAGSFQATQKLVLMK